MDFLTDFFSLSGVTEIYYPGLLLYLLVVLVVLVIGKLTFEWIAPYNLNEQLTKADNKAIAVCFGGYIFGLGMIMVGVLSGNPLANFYKDLLATAVWGILGMGLLHLARLVNDKLIFSKFDNNKELVTDRNIGTGAIEAGSYIGSAFIIMAALSGENGSWWESIVGTLIYFTLGQAAFVIFGLIYARLVKFDLHAEIEKDNVSAGVAAGMTQIAMGIIISHPVFEAESLGAFTAWFVIGVVLLILFRFFVDKLMLPRHKLDEEIQKDQNWGAAFLEGTIAVIVALLIHTVF